MFKQILTAIFLFYFQLKNPDVDIDQFLQGATPVFKKYIEDGLAELEQASSKNGDTQLNKILSENRYANKGNGKQDPDYWAERLNALKVMQNQKHSIETQCQ